MIIKLDSNPKQRLLDLIERYKDYNASMFFKNARGNKIELFVRRDGVYAGITYPDGTHESTGFLVREGEDAAAEFIKAIS